MHGWVGEWDRHWRTIEQMRIFNTEEQLRQEGDDPKE